MAKVRYYVYDFKYQELNIHKLFLISNKNRFLMDNFAQTKQK